jgi:hypothetical protein
MEVRDQRDLVVGHCADAPEGARFVMGHKPLPKPRWDSPMIPRIERHAFKVGMRAQVGNFGVVQHWPVVELREGEDPAWLPGWRPLRATERGR